MDVSPVLFHACLSDVAYLDDKEEAEARARRMLPGDEDMQLTHVHLGHMHAWLVVSTLHNSMHIAFRGTDSWEQVVNNLQLLPVPFQLVPSGGRVHGGYLQYWKALRFEVLDRVQQLVAERGLDMITTTGHSAGGSIAELVAVDCATRFARPVRAYTYGSPPVGDTAFVNRCRELNNFRSTRVVHEHDIISKVPQTLYKHVQSRPLVLRTHAKPRTVIDHHSLHHYIHSLRGNVRIV